MTLDATVSMRSLQNANAALATTSAQLSTGRRIDQASDGAAYWAIAATTASDRDALLAIQDGLRMGRSTVDKIELHVTYVLDIVREVKTLLVSSMQDGLDYAEFNSKVNDLKGRAYGFAGKQINGHDWLHTRGADAIDGKTIDFTSSLGRSTSGIAFQAIGLAVDSIKMNADVDNGLLETKHVVGGTNANFYEVRITDGAGDRLSLTQLEEYVAVVDSTEQAIVRGLAEVGVTASRLDSAARFVDLLSDAQTRAVGTLVDADMEKMSARLRAEEVRVALATEGLAIANGNASAMLQLFQ